MPTPRSVEVTAVGTIQVVWQDGHVSSYRARDLRARCPCAVCVDEWTHEVRVAPESIPANLGVKAVRRVGQYALSFVWTDGHSTGIYAYDQLRASCPCAQCR
ncbi:MAG: DUF971 domain-containing protein [Acidobacteriota bacterium]